MTGEPRMTISAIVCAYNEADYLPACLHALLAQTRQPDEIIVIDNASSDGTGDLSRGDRRHRAVSVLRLGLAWERRPHVAAHILMERDLFKGAGRLMSLGRKHFSVTRDRFDDYLAEIAFEARRARRMYDLLVIPGAEITQNHFRSRKNSHIIALNIKEWISADQPAREILEEIRRQGAFSIACHPHHRTTRRIEISTCFLWGNRKKPWSSSTCGKPRTATTSSRSRA